MQSKVRLESADRVAVVVIDNPPVNALSREVRLGLLETFRAIAEDPAIEGVVMVGAGRSFIAGADIREFGQPPVEPHLPEVVEVIENCPKPVVAAISGSALGGGFEVALAADFRIASADAGVGLPEVKLGVIPGAGGTQRVARLVGPASAIELVTSGRRVPAPAALEMGLVDAIASGDLRADAVAAVRGLTSKRKLSEQPVRSEEAGKVEAAISAARRRAKGQPAVEGALAAVSAASEVSFAEGCRREREIFLRLRASPEAAALRHLFFAEREAGKVEGLEGVTPRKVAQIGVIGAGTMGAGIAVSFADAGLSVTLVERDEAALEAGRERIASTYDRQVAAGRLSAEEAQARQGRIEPTTAFGRLGQADLVVEAVFEDMAVKEDVFRRLDAVARPGAVLASNTSYLDLDRIAAATARPGDVVGLHFFSPANVMRLLEVVRGERTAADTLATALALGRRIGKVSVVARVGEGFIGNRIFSAYRRQCEYMLEEGASPYEIDGAMEAWGFAMGPFAVFDLAGLDIAWKTRQRLAATRDPRERYVDVPDRICEAGRLGRKTGAGWYRYVDGKPQPDPAVLEMVEAASAAKGMARRAFSAEEIQNRLLATMANEGALLLGERIAQRASDIDLVLVNGYGFPAWRGGPMFAADARGLPEILAELERIKAASGFGFTIAPLLAARARSGEALAGARAE